MSAAKRAMRVVGALAITLVMATPAMAAGPGGGSGGGGGGGGGSGGGGSGGGGGGEGGGSTGSSYSDLNIVLRAPNGTPILKKYVVPASETETESTEYCPQPVSYEPIPGLPSSTNPVDGRTIWIVPLQGEWLTNPPDPLPVAEIGACDAQPQFAMFVKEIDLERLNQARMADDVLARKTSDVDTKLRYADAVALESTGRISYDGVPIDAPPENASIYRSLMQTGTIPGLTGDQAGPPAAIGPTPSDETSNSRFDAMELAAMAIGAAGSKGTPVTIDAIEYYNQIIGFPPASDYTSPWGVHFVRSADPDNPGAELASSSQLVDYKGFTYNRSQTFKGSITWLDIPTLTWKVNHILDVVPFTNLSSYDEIGTRTLTGVTAFAQLADDVRALCDFIPDNTFIPGFFMDVPGVDTYTKQLNAIHDPAVALSALPADVFQTYPFQITAALLNPWAGELIDAARLRLTIDAPDALTPDDVVATASDGQAVEFSADADGNLVGWWGPSAGFAMPPGYNSSTTFDMKVADGAPSGMYNVTIDLARGDASPVLAQDTGSSQVNANVARVLWDGSPVKYATQAAAVALPLTVYAPAEGSGRLSLAITGPGDDPDTTDVVEALSPGDVSVYGTDGTAMTAMPLTLDGHGDLVGSWNATLAAGFNPVTWYATVVEGAPVGSYTFGVALDGGNSLEPATIAISAAETHSQKPPDVGEDTTAPTVTITTTGTLGATASFSLTADEDGVTFECQLTSNGVGGSWEACPGSRTYTGLTPGTYVFSARGTDPAGNRSAAFKSASWTVAGPTGTGGGAVQPPRESVRLGGADRYQTAVATSQAQFPVAGGAGAVVLARGDDFADALVGIPLAKATNAPLLLVSGGSLDVATRGEITRVLSHGGTVYLLGGVNAIRATVEAALRELGYVPVRYAGVDRYDTAVTVAKALGSPRTVLLATGTNFPDALTAGPAAAHVSGAVLLTDGTRLPSSVRAYLSARATAVYAVGGLATEADPSATPLAGADRYATAAVVANALFDGPTTLGVASGVAFPDALCGGAYEAHVGGPLVLSAPLSLPETTARYIEAQQNRVTASHIFGDVNAVSDDVRQAVSAKLGWWAS